MIQKFIRGIASDDMSAAEAMVLFVLILFIGGSLILLIGQIVAHKSPQEILQTINQ